MKSIITGLIGLILFYTLSAQPDRWQQRVKYTMDVDMNVQTNRLAGKQKLEYSNNSPDTLKKVFFHLYFNAFQPNSMMDVKSREMGKIVLGTDEKGREVLDWDERVRDRILHLSPEEVGYQKIISLKMDGVDQNFLVKETILEVLLGKPILPKSKVVFDMVFEAQVPLQVRRSGRDNPGTGVRYSMSQWYPKISEYDYEGWHPTPYVSREFYGVWGDFDIKITIDKTYMLGSTGYLQNADQVGFGYEAAGVRVPTNGGEKLTWHFIAPNVHDFMWAADPHYKHLVRKTATGITVHLLYNGDEQLLKKKFDTMRPSVRELYKNDFKAYTTTVDNDWKKLADGAVTVLPYIQKHFGEYPYKQYSFIHGGDGGMEYPMGTLVDNPRTGNGFHELMHAWYAMMLGNNESMYPWLDEGFSNYSEALVSRFYAGLDNSDSVNGPPGSRSMVVVPDSMVTNRHLKAYGSYFKAIRTGLEEPMTTHADHYNTDYGYAIGSYVKGEIFLEQLGYITGAAVRDKILLDYYHLWRFKHPNANDFLRVAENTSGMKLDWYKEYWMNTTKMINYGIDSLWEVAGKTMIRLKNHGEMPMPIDLQLTLKDGTREMHYIPTYLMFGQKPNELPGIPRTVHDDWKWTHPTYIVETNRRLTDIRVIEIDPSQRLADINRSDNRLDLKW